jgi:DtxR family Mn-dependent transcriptional regulator
MYLHEIRLIPGQDIELIARAPFNGPLRLRIDRDEQVIGGELAEAVRACNRGHFDI